MVGVLPAPPALFVPWLLSASAAPTPIAAATMTATTSQMICRPRTVRPRPVWPPPALGANCLPRLGEACDGPAYCPPGGAYVAPDGGNGVVLPRCGGG